MIKKINIHKCDANGNIVISFEGEVIFANSQEVIIHTYFRYSKDFNIAGLLLKNGDKCIEAFYLNKWFNIFEIYDGDSDHLRGWYCNITKPPLYEKDNLYYFDLALDIIAFPHGEKILVDQDEFEALQLENQMHDNALASIDIAYKKLDDLMNKSLGEIYVR